MALLTATANAGTLFYAGSIKDGEFVADKKARLDRFSTLYSTVSATIAGGKAETTIRETIAAGEAGAVNAVCILPLPKGSVSETVRVKVAEPKGEMREVEVVVLAAADAQKLYESIARAVGSTRILSKTDSEAVVIPAVEIDEKLEIELTFSQKITAEKGILTYRCPMPDTDLIGREVERVALTVDVDSKLPLRTMFSPTHMAAIERDGLRKTRIELKSDKYAGTEDFALHYVADNDPFGLRVITHREPGEKQGYFMLVANPTGQDDKKDVIEKDVIFVLDTSGSMRGEKMEQARSSIEYCLAHLNPGDKFNIISFGTNVKSFRDNPVKGTKSEIEAALAFADELVAAGRTNIDGALVKGLAGEVEKGRLRIMIFLTDGAPTAGELVPEKILAKLPKRGENQTCVYVIGVGNDVNTHLLDKIAETTGGDSEYMAPDEEIDEKVAALYDRLSNPVLGDVKIAFGDLNPKSVYPRELHSLYRGCELMVMGQYRNAGTHTITISGTLAGVKKEYSWKLQFPDGEDEENGYVAVLWAARKIGYLLQEIRLHGHNDELVEEVVRLSKEFGIITEYTAFFADAGGRMDAPKAAEEARLRMEKARRQKGGKWAVSQAMNDKELQQRTVASPVANAYRDSAGRRRESKKVKQIGRQVFYQAADGQWVDAEEAGDRKTREVKLFSKEYFELVRKNKDFAGAQAVDWNLSVNVGDERIVVKK